MSKSALSPYSHRIGCEVRMWIRLYEKAFNMTEALPKKGPSVLEGIKPVLKERGMPGSADYERRWSVSPPTIGASDLVDNSNTLIRISRGEDKYLQGFETEYDVGKSKPDLPQGFEQARKGPVILGNPDDEGVAYTQVLTRKIKFVSNSFRNADTCHITVPMESFPFPADGSMVRSVIVEMRRGLIDPEVWAKAMSEGPRMSDGLPQSMPLIRDREGPDFAGFVDTHKITFGEGGSHVELPCRDFSGIMADTKMGGRTIRTDIPIDEAIAILFGTMPSMVGMEVVWLGPNAPGAIGEFGPKSKQKPKKAASSTPSTSSSTKAPASLAKMPKGDQQSVLDAITEYCVLSAVIPSFFGYELRLGSIQTLEQYALAAVPHMVLGKNLENLELEHKLTKAKIQPIEMRSFNPVTGKVLAARWPKDEDRKKEMLPGENNKVRTAGSGYVPPGAEGASSDSVSVRLVKGVVDHQRLEDMARGYWEETARQDMTGKFETKDVATVEGRMQGKADLLTLMAGQPIGISIASSTEDNAHSLVQRLAKMSKNEAVEWLKKQGWLAKVAEKVAAKIISTRRPLIYRTKEVSFEHSIQGATHIEVQFHSFIEVLDRELIGNKGGNYAKAKADPKASFLNQFQGVELDMYAGEFSPEKAAQLQNQIIVDAVRKGLL